MKAQTNGFDPTDTTIDNALTFQEWSESGFWIKKGSKTIGFDVMGKALFLPSQVTPAKKRFESNETTWGKHAKKAESKGTPWGVVEDFDSYVREAGMLPDSSRRTIFAINSPLEAHFMNVADKHGIFDCMEDDRDEDYY